MKFFIDEILEWDDVREILLTDPEGMKPQAEIYAEEFIRTGSCGVPKGGMISLFVTAILADHTLKLHEARGIPHEITVATLKDVNLWIGNYYKQYGTFGSNQFPWFSYHLRGELFRLGRIQFRPCKTNRAPSGEWVLETHIPQGEPLDPKKSLESFALAKEFFAKYFPEVKADYFDCHSWLLNPNFAYLMGEDSNIVQFGKLWKPLHIKIDGSAGTIERVFGFGFKREDLPNAPENTRLQRQVKDFLLRGGDLSAVYCVRPLNEE